MPACRRLHNLVQCARDGLMAAVGDVQRAIVFTFQTDDRISFGYAIAP